MVLGEGELAGLCRRRGEELEALGRPPGAPLRRGRHIIRGASWELATGGRGIGSAISFRGAAISCRGEVVVAAVNGYFIYSRRFSGALQRAD